MGIRSGWRQQIVWGFAHWLASGSLVQAINIYKSNPNWRPWKNHLHSARLRAIAVETERVMSVSSQHVFEEEDPDVRNDMHNSQSWWASLCAFHEGETLLPSVSVEKTVTQERSCSDAMITKAPLHRFHR
jgi:hypothetical protein